MSAFTEAVERQLGGVEHLSAGACAGCEECGLDEDACQANIEIASEGSFSRHRCDGCGTRLGGTRYAAHGIVMPLGKQARIHLNVCVDCLAYIANGEEPGEWRP